MDFTSPSCSLGLDLTQPQADQAMDAMPVSFAHPHLEEPMLAQLNLQGSEAVKFAEPIVQGTPVEISPSMDEAYAKMEHDAVKRKSSGKQAASTSNPSLESSSDVGRSATPGPVRQARVVHRPESDE